MVVTNSALLDAALANAARGWPVFPVHSPSSKLKCSCGNLNCHRPAKHPRTQHGFLDASIDPEVIRRWWERWPDANVGIATGASSFLALDVDPSHGGSESLENLIAEHGPLPDTPLSLTGGGGQHWLFQHVPGVGCSVSPNVLGAGLDVRAEGGYVVAPPSTHASGGSYGWELSSDPAVVPLARAPDWLIAKLIATGPINANANTDSASSGCSARVIPIDPRQERCIRRALMYVENWTRTTWLKIGMALKSTGAREQAFQIWVEWSRATTTLTVEVARLEGTTLEVGQLNPKFDPKDQRYQWDHIKEFFNDGSEIAIGTLFHFAKEAGYMPTFEEEMDIERSLISDAGLQEAGSGTMVASECGAETAPTTGSDAKSSEEPEELQDRPFPVELLNCPGLVGEVANWLLSISVRRQPALCLGSALATIGAILGRRLCSPTNLRTNIYCLGIGETGCGKEVSISKPAELLRHADLTNLVGPGEWKSDAGLRAALIDNPSHVCFIDEYPKVLKNLSGDRVPPYLLGIKRYILELFSRAGGVHVAAGYADRAVNKPIDINEPNLCIYGAGVPSDLFDALDRGAVRDGFLNRFLVFFADDQMPARQKIGSQQPPEKLVSRVKEVEQRARPSGDLQGVTSNLATGTGCRTVPIDADAEATLEAIHDRNDERIRELRAADNPLADLWNRFAEHVVKVALIRVGGDDPDRSIGLADVEWAHDVVRWCMERMHSTGEGRIADSEAEAMTKLVLRLVEGAGRKGITANTLTRRTWKLSRGARKDALQTLIDSGDVIDERVKTGGRPAMKYVSASFRQVTE